MSRCFPYPPPGFELKARSDQSELVTKEKHKEKKHKKEKRDKEKKEGKERKDKERSKDKHKEKKDRKEKHKDKNRDKDKEKDKNKSADDKKNELRTEVHNEQKLGVGILNAEEVRDSRFTEELGRRIREEEKGATNRMFEKITGPIPKGAEGFGTTIALEKERGNGNPTATTFINKEPERNDGVGQPLENNNHIYQSFSKRPANKDLVRTIEGKEKTRDRDTEGGKGDMHRDHEQEEKKSKQKNKIRDKEKEKKEKKRENGENKLQKHDKPKDSGKQDTVDSVNFKPLAPHHKDEKLADNDTHGNKRKDVETNGFLQEYEVRPNKLPRAAISPFQPTKNGRTLELGHIPPPQSSIRHGVPNNIKAKRVSNNQEHKINGTAASQPSLADVKSSLAADISGKNEAFSKTPHPDSKYLNQIYSIPKMEDWPPSDDEDWLFSSSHPQPMPKVKFEAEEAPQVWAEGLQIELADVFALPYVIPY